MNAPKIISDTLSRFDGQALAIEEGYWQFSSCGGSATAIDQYWNDAVIAITEAGGAFVNCSRYDGELGPNRVNRFDLMWPANHRIMRSLFEEFEFGRDGFRSVLTGQGDPSADTSSKILKRRQIALEHFDAMSREAPMALTNISEYCAHARFVEKPSRERADHWVDVLWDFYVSNYGREDETLVKLPSDMQKAQFYRLGRKFGAFRLGTF